MAQRETLLDFDNQRSRLKGGDRPGKLGLESFEQHLCPTVPHPHPQQLDRVVWDGGKEIEILVFADQNQIVLCCVTPDGPVFSFLHSEFADVLGGMALVMKKPGERWWQLMINEKLHFD